MTRWGDEEGLRHAFGFDIGRATGAELHAYILNGARGIGGFRTRFIGGGVRGGGQVGGGARVAGALENEVGKRTSSYHHDARLRASDVLLDREEGWTHAAIAQGLMRASTGRIPASVTWRS